MPDAGVSVGLKGDLITSRVGSGPVRLASEPSLYGLPWLVVVSRHQVWTRTG